MRQLASIQKIINIKPIPDADAIECATVLGWEVVVRKAENFKIGDLIVYVEIDSILPDRPEFEFMRNRKFRVRTIKLRKQISQGIIFSLSILDGIEKYLPIDTWEVDAMRWYRGERVEGMDVTEVLGIKKYDPQADAEDAERSRQESVRTSRFNKFFLKYSWYRTLFFWLRPKVDKGWPKFIPHTDETRVQAIPALPQMLHDRMVSCYETEKLDGQSATYFIVRTKRCIKRFTKYLFGVCSRRIHLRKKHKCSWWDIAISWNIESKLKQAVKDLEIDIAIQGEIIGPGIQNNKYKLKEYDFYVFNVFNITEEKYFKFDQFESFCKKYGFKTVPVLSRNIIPSPTVEALLKRATSNSVVNIDILREGIVIRTLEEFPDWEHNIKNMTTFKAVSSEFLLQYGE